MSQHVATWWPNARNMMRPTVLRYVALKRSDRLAMAFKYWTNNVATLQYVALKVAIVWPELDIVLKREM